MSHQIRLAIIGGGLAGASCANALAHNQHLDIHVFESAPVMSEHGAAVALAINSQRALRHVLSAQGAGMMETVMRRAQAVPMRSTRNMLAYGPEAGAVVLDMSKEKQSLIVHRGSLLRELLAPLPKEALHVNKKVASIKSMETSFSASPNGSGNDGGVEITFEDGTVDRFDGVIGADGVFSVVRKFVLRDHDWSSVGPSPSGFWDARRLVPYERARAVLGEAYLSGENERQYSWVGHGAFLLHDVLDNGTLVQCIMSGVGQEIPADRRVILTRERLMTHELKGWLEGPIARKMIDLLLLDETEIVGYYNLEHKDTPSYANGCVCIVGDAAHAMTPWQGAGVGQAFEDAAVLGSLLNHVSNREDIQTAFRAFDAVRRQRCQRVIDSSRETGMIKCGLSSEVGMNAQEMREGLDGRWDFIINLDLERHIEDALIKFRHFQGH